MTHNQNHRIIEMPLTLEKIKQNIKYNINNLISLFYW